MDMYKFKKVEGYSIEGMYPKYGTGTFKVLLQDGEYYGEMVLETGGNVQGLDLISTIQECLKDGDVTPNMGIEENKEYLLTDDEGYLEGVVLKDEKGKELELLFENDDEFLTHIVVGIVMVGYRLEGRD